MDLSLVSQSNASQAIPYNYAERNRKVIIGSAVIGSTLAVLGIIAAVGATLILNNKGLSKTLQIVSYSTGSAVALIGIGFISIVLPKACKVNELVKLTDTEQSTKLVQAIRSGNFLAVHFNLAIGANPDKKVSGQRPYDIANQLGLEYIKNLLKKYEALDSVQDNENASQNNAAQAQANQSKNEEVT